MAAVIGILSGFMAWVPEGPSRDVLFYLALAITVICAVVVAWVAVKRRSIGVGVLAVVTLLSPVIIIAAYFATW